MRVVRAGKLPETIMSGTCVHCGCIVEAEVKEAGRVEEYKKTRYYIECPTDGCERRIWLDPKKD